MKQATLRFYAELNDFLPPERRFADSTVSFHVSPAVRDVIESLGVPHTEVDLILANGKSADFSYPVQDGDRVSVYPVFESMDITPVLRLRPHPLRKPRFVLDVHLGRLAAYLRLFGFDTLYRADHTDGELARISSEEDRILLTRDVGLLKRAAVTRGRFVRSTNPRLQLAEVLERFDLGAAAVPFSRCLACNGMLAPVAKAGVEGRAPAGVLARHDEFLECRECRRVYWKGTHYDRMRNMVEASSLQTHRER